MTTTQTVRQTKKYRLFQDNDDRHTAQEGDYYLTLSNVDISDANFDHKRRDITIRMTAKEAHEMGVLTPSLQPYSLVAQNTGHPFANAQAAVNRSLAESDTRLLVALEAAMMELCEAYVTYKPTKHLEGTQMANRPARAALEDARRKVRLCGESLYALRASNDKAGNTSPVRFLQELSFLCHRYDARIDAHPKDGLMFKVDGEYVQIADDKKPPKEGFIVGVGEDFPVKLAEFSLAYSNIKAYSPTVVTFGVGQGSTIKPKAKSKAAT